MKINHTLTSTWPSRIGIALAMLLGFFTLQQAVAQAPANDLCDNALPIPCSGIATGSTVMANLDGPVLTCDASDAAPDVWYTITGTGHAITASLCGSTYDTQIDVYTGDCSALVNIGGCDDQFCGDQSQMTWNSTIGVAYRIRVHGYNGETGTYNLEVTCAPANDLCANATPINCGVTLSGETNVGATVDLFPPCNLNGGLGLNSPSVWYSFTGTGGTVMLSTCSTIDMEIAVFSGTCSALVCVDNSDEDDPQPGCGPEDETLLFSSVLGTAYYVMVQGSLVNTVGTFSISMECLPSQPNDPCSNANLLTCGDVVSGTTTTATLDGPATDCNGNSVAPDVWYMINGTANDITVSLCGSNYNTKIDVYTGNCIVGLISIGVCSDDFCGLQSEVTWPSLLGPTYFIRVHGMGGATGDYTLSVTCASAPIVLTCPMQPPPFVCPNTPVFGTPTVSGGCSTPIVTFNDVTTSLNCPGNYDVTRTWTATDNCMGTATCSLTANIRDFQAPIITCLPQATPINCPAVPVFIPPTVTDACSNVTLTFADVTTPGNCAGRYSVTRTWTATDDCTNYSQCSSTIEVQDTVPPVITYCPPDTVLACNWTGLPPFGTPIITDNCSEFGYITIIAVVVSNGCQRSQTITYEPIDYCGNVSASCVQVFTWTVDVTPPTFTFCPPGADLGCNPTAVPGPGAATATDACGAPTISSSLGPITSNGCQRSQTRTYTATDGCGNTATCAQVFTWTVDVTPPTFTFCPLGTDLGCNPTSVPGPGNATATDACGAPTISSSLGPVISNGCQRSRTRTYTATDDCGLTSTCEQVFTWKVTTPIELFCPAAVTTQACLSQTTINIAYNIWLLAISASGGCNAVVTNNSTGPPDRCGGTKTVTFTATGDCGSTGTCTASFTVPPPPPVVFNCPANASVSACLTQAQLNAQYAAWLNSATGSGGCNGVLTNNSPGVPQICNLAGSTTTVTFSYTSSCAPITTTCTATFTVQPYPLFAVPANTASTVACPALAVPPVPPVVLDGCGKTLTPSGPVIVNVPNPLTCEGTRTFTWAYTDCAGTVRTWRHVTTVEREPFSIATPFGSATVDCPDKTDVQPTPPVVLSACGEILTPVLHLVSAKPGCEGNRAYTFRYTDCEGNTADWLFMYLVEYQDFELPESEGENVECPLNVIEPVPPTVFDNCGKLLTPTGPFVHSVYNEQGCEAARRYIWNYQDCEGNVNPWSKGFNFLYSADFEVFNDETNVVACLAYAVLPVPPTLYDACGQEIKVALTGVSEDISPSGCSGWRKYDFEYTDCGGHSHPWSFSYEINDNEAPLGVCPSGNAGSSPVAVSVTDLACMEDVPCPADHDFSTKIEEMLVAGNYFDVCSGDELVVELDSYSDLWQCADPDGDGHFTFGRSFYFRIADPCGNEFPSLCEVTYAGDCLPLETFRQEDWGIAGAMPGNAVSVATTDLSVIGHLLGASSPLVIGGSHRSLTITDPPCIVNLLPGMGLPAVLSNCHQTNCTGCNPMGIGGLKNALAANAIALNLNLRYNVQYNALTMEAVRNQSLGCLEIHECILNCSASLCQLRFFDASGGIYQFPFTTGGLLDMANLFLDGGLSMSTAQKTLYGTAINQSLLSVNAYWSEGQLAVSCGPADEASSPFAEGDENENAQTETSFSISIAPNPATRYITLKLGGLDEERELRLEIYNVLGQKKMSRDFGKAASLSERVELDGLQSGIYIAVVQVGYRVFAQTLVVSKEENGGLLR